MALVTVRSQWYSRECVSADVIFRVRVLVSIIFLRLIHQAGTQVGERIFPNMCLSVPLSKEGSCISALTHCHAGTKVIERVFAFMALPVAVLEGKTAIPALHYHAGSKA